MVPTHEPVRPPAVAGSFYPADPVRLRETVQACLQEAGAPEGPRPKALIVPHAGFRYSGSVAARAYVRLAPWRRRVNRVVLLGPSHRVPFRGIALTTAEAFATPLGLVRVDVAEVARLNDPPGVRYYDAAHAMEHSLEVQLPFLQMVLEDFTLVPLVVGEASPGQVAGVLEQAWGGPETLVAVSSDLSHYLDHASARRADHATCEAILSLDPGRVDGESACGWFPVRGFLTEARRRGMVAELLDVRNSGDTAGDKDRVVGYGAFAFS